MLLNGEQDGELLHGAAAVCRLRLTTVKRETSVEALEGISTRHRHASTCIEASRDEVRRLLYTIRGDPAAGNSNSARSVRAGLLSGLARRAGETLTGRQRSRHKGIFAVIAARGEWWLPCAAA